MKSKILFILHYPPPIHGAAVVGGFIKNSKTINTTFSTKFINLSTSKTVDDIGKQGIAKWWRYFGIVFSTFFTCLFWRPQVVYITLTSHGLGLWKDAVIVVICRLLRIKHVFHFHNKGVVNYAKNNIKADRLYRFLFKKAHIILLSPLLFGDIAAYVSKEKVFFCANGIPELSKITKSEKEIANTPLQLLFLSNLIVSKGIWQLLDVCLKLKLQAIPFQCTIVGGEGDVSSKELERKILDLGIQEQVTYLGKQYGKAKDAIFQKSEVFVHPTFNDCFPLVILEAMQHSIPIISSHEGAISEIVEDGKTGFIVNTKDIDQIAEKIEILIKNPQLRKSMGAAGRKKYEQEFTLQAFETRFISILKELVK